MYDEIENAISTKLPSFPSLPQQFNIFQIDTIYKKSQTARYRQEIFQSKMIGWLMSTYSKNSEGNMISESLNFTSWAYHSIGTNFIISFLKLLNIDIKSPIIKSIVSLEESNAAGRTDITVEIQFSDYKSLLIIENKLFDQRDAIEQLNGYKNAKSWDVTPICILIKNHPTDEDRNNPYGFFVVDYLKIYDLIYPLLKLKLPFRVQWFIEQWAEFILYNLNDSDKPDLYSLTKRRIIELETALNELSVFAEIDFAQTSGWRKNYELDQRVDNKIIILYCKCQKEIKDRLNLKINSRFNWNFDFFYDLTKTKGSIQVRIQYYVSYTARDDETGKKYQEDMVKVFQETLSNYPKLNDFVSNYKPAGFKEKVLFVIDPPFTREAIVGGIIQLYYKWINPLYSEYAKAFEDLLINANSVLSKYL
jgi:hypothetical protein